MVGAAAAALALAFGAPSCPEAGELSDAERAERIDAAVIDAVRAFDAGDARAALAAIDRADCLEERPDHDFMRGSILKEEGDCAAAVESFDAFLEADVPAADAKEAGRLRDACLASMPPPPAAPPPVVPAEHAGPTPPRPCPPPPPPDRLGIGLTAAGAVLAVGGIGLVAAAHGLKNAAPDRPRLSEHDQALDTARRLNPAGWASLAVGAALLASGAIRLGIVRARRRRARANRPAHCP